MIVKLVLFAILLFELYLIRNFHRLKIRSYIKMAYSLVGISAILSITFPSLLQELADFLGVGRGADLLLYLMSIGFIGFVGLSLAKHREIDSRVTILTRNQAISTLNKFKS